MLPQRKILKGRKLRRAVQLPKSPDTSNDGSQMLLQLPNELLMHIFSVLDLDNTYLSSTCFGLSCTRLYLIYRTSKAVRRYKCLSLRTMDWTGTRWIALHQVLQDNLGAGMPYYDTAAKFIRLKQDGELDMSAAITDLTEKMKNLKLEDERADLTAPTSVQQAMKNARFRPKKNIRRRKLPVRKS